MSIKNYCNFVRTEMNLIAFLGPSNCVNTQYAVLSGAMHKQIREQTTKVLNGEKSVLSPKCALL